MVLGDNLGIQLWTRTGSQGDVWRFGRMSATKDNANIVFEGNTRKILIEIDSFDIFLLNSYCWYKFYR